MRKRGNSIRHGWMYSLVAVFVFGCASDDIAPVDVESQAFDDLRTEVQAAIADPSRATTAIRIIDQLESDLASLRAGIRERRDSARRLNADYDTTREEFETFLTEVEAEVLENKKRISELNRALFDAVTSEERSAVAKAHTRAMNAAIRTIQTI